MELRTCKKCGIEKEFTSQFYPHLNGKPKGFTCKKCVNSYQRAWKLGLDEVEDWGSDEIPPTQKDKIAALKAKFPKLFPVMGEFDVDLRGLKF